MADSEKQKVTPSEKPAAPPDQSPGGLKTNARQFSYFAPPVPDVVKPPASPAPPPAAAPPAQQSPPQQGQTTGAQPAQQASSAPAPQQGAGQGGNAGK